MWSVCPVCRWNKKRCEWASLFSKIQSCVAASIAPNEGQHLYAGALTTRNPLCSGLSSLALGDQSIQDHSQAMGDGVGGSEWVSQKSAWWGCVQHDHHYLPPSCDTTRGEPGRRCSLGTPYSSPVMSCRSLFRPSHEDYEHYIYGMLFKQEFGLWALQSQYLGPFLSIMWCWVSYWTSSARISPYVSLRQFTSLYYCCSIAQSCLTLCYPSDLQ